MLQLAIVEDDDRQAKVLAEYAARYGKEHQIEIVPEHFENGLKFLESYRGNFDAVLLDIAMPLMDGMECAKRLRERDEKVPIVFITSMAQYAIRGYEVEAMAFMIKPVSYAEFGMKMDRIIRRLQARKVAPYAISQKDGAKIVDMNDIYYVEVLSHNLIFHTHDGIFEMYGKLGALEEDVRFDGFIKPSPSYLVNCTHIASIGKDSLEVNGDAVPISRRRRKECLEKLAKVIGGRLS